MDGATPGLAAKRRADRAASADKQTPARERRDRLGTDRVRWGHRIASRAGEALDARIVGTADGEGIVRPRRQTADDALVGAGRSGAAGTARVGGDGAGDEVAETSMRRWRPGDGGSGDTGGGGEVGRLCRDAELEGAPVVTGILRASGAALVGRGRTSHAGRIQRQATFQSRMGLNAGPSRMTETARMVTVDFIFDLQIEDIKSKRVELCFRFRPA